MSDDSPAAEGLWFVARGQALLLTLDDRLPPYGPCPFVPHDAVARTLRIGEIEGIPCFAAEITDEVAPPPGMAFVGFRGLPDKLDAIRVGMAARALELLEWDRSNRFCGACGAPTRRLSDSIVRHCSNDACHREHYPRVSPVVIVAVERGPEILLGRSPHFPAGLFSVLAGFVDAGEAVEQAIHREIFEETRLTVRNLRYFASQPWPFPHSLMLGYHADYEGGDIVCAPGEIEEARFYHVDRLPERIPGSGTIAHWLIADFRRRHGRG